MGSNKVGVDMKLAFNGVGCGWGNNGGTQSIFRMADSLGRLGVDVELWSDMDSNFTWFNPRTRLRKTSLEDAPDVDVLINTGCHTTLSTYFYPRKQVGVQWLRGHETWQMTESELHHLYSLDMPLWANSEWFRDIIDCEIQYCGIPHQEFYRVDTPKTDKVTIGCLWNNMPTKGNQLISDLINTVKNVDWILFGKELVGPSQSRAMYVSNPDMQAKREIYSACDIWLASTELEGLHIPPMEAALCGTPVIANAKPSAGNVDYCINGETALLYNSSDEIPTLIKRLCDKDLGSKLNTGMKAVIKEKIGDVDMNAKKMLEKIEKVLCYE